MDATQSALVHALERVDRIHAARRADPVLAQAMSRVGEWQSRRLRMTYADLASDPRYVGAVSFFQNDLYGGTDFSRRDADLARVAPAMMRLLPHAVIGAVARAIELNALSHELDRTLASRLRDPERFSVADYCVAYRDEADYAGRHRQFDLIAEVGHALDRYVRTPMIGAALTVMRQPARLAGFAALQDFLERGFSAFRRMKGAGPFLAIIDEREHAIHRSIVEGSDAPFPDPSH